MKTKNKRMPISIIRLYKLSQKFIRENLKSDLDTITNFLKFINKHKNDEL